MLDFLIGNDFLSAIIAFGLVLIPAVIIHELGHFLAAKAVGITILEFGIGYPPRLAKLFNWGETEFTLNIIPLGGFVRPLGEDMIRPLTVEETEQEREKLVDRMSDKKRLDESDRVVEEQEAYIDERAELQARGITNIKSVNEVKPWPRILFMSGGAVANLVSAFLIFMLIGLIGVEQPSGARVVLAEIPESSMFTDAGLMSGDFIETVNGETFATSREFFARLSELGNEQVTLEVVRVTETDQTEFSTDLVVDVDEARALDAASARLLVTSVQENSPANEAGMIAGDYITGLAGTSLADSSDPFDTLLGLNRANEGKTVAISIVRDGEGLSLDIVPRVDPAPGTGHLGAGVMVQFVGDTGLIYGIGPDQIEYVPLSLGDSVQYAAGEMNRVLTLIVDLPVRIIRGQVQPEEGRIVSIVGITQLGGVFLQQSVEDDQPIVILNFIALISIALGITNLLPIPPLDGGRILFVIIELIRGRPIPPKLEERVLIVGLFFLLSLGVFVIINDILNPLTDLLP